VIRLFIDARERDFLNYIGDLGQVTMTNLEAGDYVVVTDDRAVVVERKTFRDFISSYRNGRLWEQLVRMLAQDRFEDVPVVRRLLIIERSELDTSTEDLSRLESSVIGAQLECIFTYHVPVVFLEGKNSVERFLRVLVKREEEGKNDKEIPARWYRPRFPKDLPEKDQRCYFLGSIPGVGEHLAGQLMERYESVDDVCKASVKDLQKVPGFGKKRAERLHEFLH
jgi:DNA excision repair protein ERCC-4